MTKINFKSFVDKMKERKKWLKSLKQTDLIKGKIKECDLNIKLITDNIRRYYD